MQAVGNMAVLTKFTRQAVDPGAVLIYKGGCLPDPAING